MATIAIGTGNPHIPNGLKYTWETLTASDVGAAVPTEGKRDINAQVIGTFGGTVTIQGSNDGGTTFTDLHDVNGDLIAITSAAFVQVLEAPELIRPSAGAGVSDVDVHLRMYQ